MASIVDALGQAAANAGWGAARPTGLVIVAARLGRILKVFDGHLTPYQPNVFDVVADDWQAGPLETIAAALQKQAAQGDEAK